MDAQTASALLEPPSTQVPKPASAEWPATVEHYDDGAALVFIFEIPSVPAHSLCVSRAGGSLTVSGLRPIAPNVAPSADFGFGQFTRHIDLPPEVHNSTPDVSLWRGLLIIRLPR
jgi:HSP20 family molecular chaperone IbpA